MIQDLSAQPGWTGSFENQRKSGIFWGRQLELQKREVKNRKSEVRSQKWKFLLLTSYFSLPTSPDAVICVLPVSSYHILTPYLTTSNSPFSFGPPNLTQIFAGHQMRAKPENILVERKPSVFNYLRLMFEFVLNFIFTGTIFV